MDLANLGWNHFFAQHFAEFAERDLAPARIVRQDRQLYQIQGEAGVMSAEISGHFLHGVREKNDFPAVGDWVAIQPRPDEGRATIQGLLPRKSKFPRRTVDRGGRGGAGERATEQVIVANVDSAFLVGGLDGGRNFNLQRLERYLTMAWDGGANPVVVLNKADMCDEVEVLVSEVEAIAFGVPVHAMSALEEEGVEELHSYLGPGQTAVLLGPSGVGKSTLINALLGGEEVETGAVRQGDQRGRHTTTWAELLRTPAGGMIADTPGMRDMQLWADEESLQGSFEDIDALAQQCRFNDCRHQREPGCAVNQALDSGQLEQNRFDSYRKLEKELQYLADKQVQKGRRSEKEQWERQLSKNTKKYKKYHPKL